MTTIVTKIIRPGRNAAHGTLIHATVWRHPEFVVQDFDSTTDADAQHLQVALRVARMARLFGEWVGAKRGGGYRFVLAQPGGTDATFTVE